MNIKIKKVSESVYKRQLVLAEKLDELLGKVAKYKAMRKFHELLYEKPADCHTNRYYNDLLKTDFGYSCYKVSYSDKFRFRFYPIKRRTAELEFDITCKSIPAIRSALDAYKTKLIDWDKNSDEPLCPIYKIEHLISDSFSGEYTKTGFDRQKDALTKALKQASQAVSSLDYDAIESTE